MRLVEIKNMWLSGFKVTVSGQLEIAKLYSVFANFFNISYPFSSIFYYFFNDFVGFFFFFFANFCLYKINF